MMERIAKLCVLLVVVAAASVGAAEEDASAKEAQAPGSTDANESQEWNFPSVLDPVECSNYFHPHYQVNGSQIQEGGWVPPMLHSKSGQVLQCGESVNAEDHSLLVFFPRKDNGRFIVEVLPSSEPDERHGLDHGVCDHTRVFDVETSLFTVPFQEGSTLKLRALYTRSKGHELIFVTRDCEYNVIASKETLKTLELERQRAIKQQQLEEAEQREAERAQQDAQVEALDEALLEEEESLE